MPLALPLAPTQVRTEPMPLDEYTKTLYYRPFEKWQAAKTSAQATSAQEPARVKRGSPYPNPNPNPNLLTLTLTLPLTITR